MTHTDIENHVIAVAQICQSHENTIFEAANEGYHPTQDEWLHDFSTIRHLVSLAKRNAPDVLIGGTAQADDEGLETFGAEYLPIHLDRGRPMWDQVRRIREAENGEAQTNEPAVVQEAEKELDPEWWLVFGFLARGFEIDAVFHSDDGVNGRMLGDALLSAQAFLQGFTSIIPDDLDVAYQNSNVNGGWPDSPVASHNVETCVRAYSFVAGNHGWTIALGITGSPDLVFKAGWRPERILTLPHTQIYQVDR